MHCRQQPIIFGDKFISGSVLSHPKMYQDTVFFDHPDVANNGFPQANSTFIAAAASAATYEENMNLPMEEPSYPHPQDQDSSVEIQPQMGCNMENNKTPLMQQVIHDSNHILSYEQSSWDPSVQDMGYNPNNPEQQLQNGHQSFNLSSIQEAPYSSTPDLLNLLHLPAPNSSISFTNPGSDSLAASQVLYDPLFHLNLPPQPPMFRELFQSLPSGYNLPISRGGSVLFGVGDEREGNGGVYQDADGRQFDNGVLEFSREMGSCLGKRKHGKMTKHYPTEKDRRVHMKDKYDLLAKLVPNPSKTDRASIVGDAIEYIKELNREVNELKILVERKRCSRERIKRQKTEEEGELESCDTKLRSDQDQFFNGSLRSSWLQRKSKYDTQVDVHIIDDEVTIKLVQRKKINCLLFVSKTLDELQLDLHHVAGGIIGEHCSFLFNTKIYEGSTVYASAIANRLIEVVDRQHASCSQPSSSF